MRNYKEEYERWLDSPALSEKEWAELGWNLIVIWECGLATLKERERTFRKVGNWLKEIGE